MKIVLVFVIVQFTVVMSSDLTQTQWVTVARCRASCLNKFVKGEYSDAACIDSTKCYVCWQMCERVHSSVWASLCQPSRANLCTDGCRLACDVTASASGEVSSLPSWTFPQSPVVTVASKDILILDWAAPVPSDDVMKQRMTSHQVYVLFWRYDQQEEWKLASMTGELWSTIDGTHREYPGLTFQLLAVSPSGPVADTITRINYDDVSSKEDKVTEHEDEPVYGQDPGKLLVDDLSSGNARTVQETPSPVPSATPAPVQKTDLLLTVSVEQSHGVLRGNLSWTAVINNNPASPVLYTITWTRLSCQVQESLPECHLPNHSLVSLREQYNEKELYTLLPGLTYNSKYLVDVEFRDGEVHSLIFYTPRCGDPSDDFTRCASQDRFSSLSLPQVTREELSAVQKATQLPLYATLTICILLAVVMVTVTVLLVKKQKELHTLVNSQVHVWKERARSIRSSIRSRASSFRTSVRSKSSGFHNSVRRVLSRHQYSPTSSSDSLNEEAYTPVVARAKKLTDEDRGLDSEALLTSTPTHSNSEDPDQAVSVSLPAFPSFCVELPEEDGTVCHYEEIAVTAGMDSGIADHQTDSRKEETDL